jgi:hypothetical protein
MGGCRQFLLDGSMWVLDNSASLLLALFFGRSGVDL